MPGVFGTFSSSRKRMSWLLTHRLRSICQGRSDVIFRYEELLANGLDRVAAGQTV
jgi:hypothetical protein